MFGGLFVFFFFEFLTFSTLGAVTFSIVWTPETMEPSPWIRPALSTEEIAHGLFYPSRYER
jgi:hypothetical protein